MPKKKAEETAETTRRSGSQTYKFLKMADPNKIKVPRQMMEILDCAKGLGTFAKADLITALEKKIPEFTDEVRKVPRIFAFYRKRMLDEGYLKRLDEKKAVKAVKEKKAA